MLEVPDPSCESCSWYDMATSLWYNPFRNFGCINLFWRYKGHTFSLSPYLSFWGHCRFLTWVWKCSPDSDIVNGLWYGLYTKSCCLYWLWRCKEHPHLLCSDVALVIFLFSSVSCSEVNSAFTSASLFYTIWALKFF